MPGAPADFPKIMPIERVERIIFEFELIRVVIRAPADTYVKSYYFERRAPSYMTVMGWIASRIRPVVGDLEFVVLDGYSRIPPRLMTLDTLRKTYER